MAKKQNPTILRQNASIGNLSAEADDEFLFDCFVFHPLVDELKDVTSRQMVLLGRTGSGKTAFLRHIEQSEENVRRIDLFEMAMEYVSNSDVIRFLMTLGIDLDLFFQALWKHILCLEYIRAKYRTSDQASSSNFFNRIWAAFSGDDRKRRAIEYLQSWQGKFWITADENIKEITQKLETNLNAELGGEISEFKSKAGYNRSLSNEKRSEVVARAKKFVSAHQLTDLSQVLDLLEDYDGSSTQKYFILIDKVDEKWVDDELRFKLIRALIECLKSFRKITDLKVVVAMRVDVYERVISENKDVGFQREKYDDYTATIEWSRQQLLELVEKRIRHLYRKQYTKSDVKFTDIFDPRVGQQDAFEYLVARTFQRPRDILSFVNECLLQSVGRTEVFPKDVKEAELVYSRKRLSAIFDEWRSLFPALEQCTKIFEHRKETSEISELAIHEILQDLVLQIASNEELNRDPLYRLCVECADSLSNKSIYSVAFALISQCYRAGIVGVKLNPETRYIYSYKDTGVIIPSQITLKCRVQVHRMLHRALNIKI